MGIYGFPRPMNELNVLHEEIHACRRCLDEGFPIEPPPLAWGAAPAPFIVIGQAPGKTDRAGGRMYLGRPLRNFLAGFTPPASRPKTSARACT